MFFQSKRYNILDQRYNIAFFAAFFSIPTCFFFGKEFYDIFTCYIILVIAFDQVFRLFKPTPLDQQKILDSDKMTTEQIETYIKSKRVYRLKAISIAFLIEAMTKVWAHEFSTYFISTYAIVWSLYPFIRIFYLKIPAPKLSTILITGKNEDLKGFLMQNPSNSFSDRWTSPQSYAMNRMTPGTIEWTCNRNRLQ